MKKHMYRVTLEYLGGPKGESPGHEPMRFEAGNHDDIFTVVEKVQSRGDFEPEEAKAFSVGLKLFGEVMLAHKDEPLFADFMPHFVRFMQELKKGIPSGS